MAQALTGSEATRHFARVVQLRAMEFELSHGRPIAPAWGRVWAGLRREFNLPVRCDKRRVYQAFVSRYCEPRYPQASTRESA